MNRRHLILLGIFVLLFGCKTVQAKDDIATPRVINAEIRTKTSSFKRNISIEITKYDEARIEHAYLEHKRKKKKSGEKDYLYVKGAVKNLMNRHLSGAIVTATFIDNNGQVVGHEFGEVIPRIIRLNGAKEGYFTVKTKYDPFVTQCKLTLNWSGKEEE